MIYLDTHVVVWLYAGLVEKFSQAVMELMNEMVALSPSRFLQSGRSFELNLCRRFLIAFQREQQAGYHADERQHGRALQGDT